MRQAPGAEVGEFELVNGGRYRVDAHVTFEHNVRSSVYVGLALVENESPDTGRPSHAAIAELEDHEPTALAGCYQGPVAFFGKIFLLLSNYFIH